MLDGPEEERFAGVVEGGGAGIVPVDEALPEPGCAGVRPEIEPDGLRVLGDLPRLVDLAEVHE